MGAGETDSQGLRDAVTVLPFVTIVLLMPPVALIFAAPHAVFGVPLIVVYVFAVWIVVILAACLAARRLGAAKPRSWAAPEAQRRQD